MSGMAWVFVLLALVQLVALWVINPMGLSSFWLVLVTVVVAILLVLGVRRELKPDT